MLLVIIVSKATCHTVDELALVSGVGAAVCVIRVAGAVLDIIPDSLPILREDAVTLLFDNPQTAGAVSQLQSFGICRVRHTTSMRLSVMVRSRKDYVIDALLQPVIAFYLPYCFVIDVMRQDIWILFSGLVVLHFIIPPDCV